MSDEVKKEGEAVIYKANRGLDVGTNAIVVSRLDQSDVVHTSWIRDAYLVLDCSGNQIVKKTMIKSFKANGYNFFEKEGDIIIIGDHALLAAAERNLVTSRPLSQGVISPKDSRNLPIFKVLLSSLLGEPVVENEKIVFSIPAGSVADEKFDSEYHCTVIKNILSSLGYEGIPQNEAESIVYSEMAEFNYTGMAISFGAGQSNLSLCSNGQPLCNFAIGKGGDSIDLSTSTALGYDPNSKDNTTTPSLCQLVKESCDLDLLNPDLEDRIQVALVAYYKSFLNYVVDNIVYYINKLESKPRFNEPISIVVSGGTSKPKNFVKVFEEAFNRKVGELPFEVGKIIHASDPLDAVARGCLISCHLLDEE